MRVKTIKAYSIAELQSELEGSLQGEYKPTLAIVFLSIKQEHELVCSLLDNEGIQIFGCTTSGEFNSAEVAEGSIVVMLLDLNPDDFRILFYETDDTSTFETTTRLGVEGKKIFANPAFIIASGWIHSDGEEIVKGIETGFGGDVTVFGGMAGDDLQLREPYVFTKGRRSIHGIVAIVLNEDKIAVWGIATCGWKPIGITKTVTKKRRQYRLYH